MMAKTPWRTSITPPNDVDFEKGGGESEVDISCYEETSVTIARILRGERVLGLKNPVYDDSENPTRRRGFGWADADELTAGLEERKEAREQEKARRAKAVKAKATQAGDAAANKAAAQAKQAQAANDAAAGASIG